MEPNRTTGRLVLVGDLGPPSWGDGAALREALGPGDDPRPPRVVLIPVGPRGAGARADPAWEALRRLGVGDLRTLEVADPDDAGRPHGLGIVERAPAALVVGDDPGLVARLLAGTGLLAALGRLANSGRLVAAGPAASAMGGGFLVDGLGVVDGLGLLPGAILDPEFARDGRPDRLRPALAGRPGAFGLGLGVGAVLAFDGSAIEVRGRGPVAVVPPDAPPTLLGPGDRFGLVAGRGAGSR